MGGSLHSFPHEAPLHGPTTPVTHSIRGLRPRSPECISADLPHTLVDWPTLAGGTGRHDKQGYHFLAYSPIAHHGEETKQA